MRHRFGKAPFQTQHIGKIGKSARIARIDPHRQGDSFQGFIKPAVLRRQNAQHMLCGEVCRIGGQNLAIDLFRFGQSSAAMQGARLAE